MIIVAHAHLGAPASLYGYRSTLIVSGGQHGASLAGIGDDELKKSADGNVALMDEVGTDIQFLSPRPFMLINRGKLADSQLWVRSNNELIARTIAFHPTRFRGVAAIPQLYGEKIETTFDEIDYAVEKLGFIGLLVNPDPGEGVDPSPTLADPYWYPLYEKAIAMKLPIHIPSGGCCGRETYDEHFATEESLAITAVAHSEVFAKFPSLKLMISHGGGSIPYQIGRWRSHWFVTQAASNPVIGKYFRELEAAGWAGKSLPPPPKELVTFDEVLRKFYFDVDVHNKDSLELLLKTVGTDRCLFGTERPGSGGGIDLSTGRPMDDFKFTIDRIEFLSEANRRAIYEGNARKVFTRL